MDLTGVETAQGYVPVSGGMRLGFTRKPDDAALPELQAGDQIAALTEARLPLVYKDTGAFDRRDFLPRQGIHVLATLHASRLLEKAGTAPATWESRLARVRGRLRERVDSMFPDSVETAGLLRAMLLGDRSFVGRNESLDFRKTGVFHVLVVAGLHVGAFLFWAARKLALPQMARTVFRALGATCICSGGGATRSGVARGINGSVGDCGRRFAGSLHVPVEQERRPQSFQWDGVQVDVLCPENALDEVAPLAKNNDSLVVRLKFGERTILLPGDAEKQVEHVMLNENEPGFLNADVLKVGHHGSKNSSMPEFLGAVSPQVAIISAGEENPYGHPHAELLERLEAGAIRTYRTDRDGAFASELFRGLLAREPALTQAQAPNQHENNQQ